MNIGKLIKGMIASPLLLNKLMQIRRRIYSVIGQLSATYSMTNEPVAFNDRLSLPYKKISVGEDWGGFFQCAWFNFTANIDKKYVNENLQLIIDVTGEGCIYDEEGTPVKGLSKRLCFTDGIGAVSGGKHLFILPKGSDSVNLWVDTGNNGWDGKSTGQAKLKRADIVICNQKIYDLYYDYLTLYLLLTTLPAGSTRRREIIRVLRNASSVLSKYNNEEVDKAREILRAEIDNNPESDTFLFYATGHAHLDLAWLWPIRETKRKAARTFSNQLKLMENHSDYVFGASQPQQFQWMKDMYPALYKKLQEASNKGNLEPQGGMWVEADTNVTGSESLVRQVLYGKRFFQQEFNKDMKILWLPDVFGFSGALPQIIKKAGMDFFLTIKLSWNEQNKFPYHSFVWEGIDDSSILVHMPPEGTYNSDGNANAVKDAYDRYVEKFTNCAALPYGVGDGGGGPGEAHYEIISREANLKGMKKVKMATSLEFFNELDKYTDRLPKFKGELYLEKHQGTLTTQAKSKLYNRKIEILLRNIEILATYSMNKGYKYPKDKIENIWKEVLLYQFHDIIPGSSINRVYVESVQRYQEMIDELNTIFNEITAFLSKGKLGLTAINTLPFKREENYKHNREWLKVRAEPFASATFTQIIEKFNELSYGDDFIENDKIKIVFNVDGSIKSYYDKVNDKDFSGDYLNKLTVYQDKKLHYNAWDIDINYTKKKKEYFKLINSESLIDGPTVIRRNTYTYNKSRLVQDVILMHNRDYAEFKTDIEWLETHKMLRADFRPSVYSDSVLCDIQWGNISRTTKTDTSIAHAQYEICAHKYVDVMDDNLGFSLINDCKYGHRVKDGLISLNLLRSPVFPDETADKGSHSFTYAIYTHKGNALESKLLEHSYSINNPLMVTENAISIDTIMRSDKANIIVETIKKSEDNDNIIIRAFETAGKKTECGLTTILKYNSAYECDLLENVTNDINLDSLTFKPYEIKTILLKTKE